MIGAGVLFGALTGLLLIHGWPGLLLGAAFGWMFDQARARAAAGTAAPAYGFVEPLFALLGAVAKADGRVSQAEIAVAERLMTRMGLNDALRRRAIARFNAGKQADFDVAPAIGDLKQWCGGRRHLAYPLLDVVADTVLAEGAPSPAKFRILRQLAWALHFSDFEIAMLLATKGYVWGTGGSGPRQRTDDGQAPPRRAAQGPDPYAVLGVPPDADAATVKRAYRKLISEHHPDRLGDLPEDLRRRAEERARDINAAYERIQAERGFR